jgi:hypothetical protein
MANPHGENKTTMTTHETIRRSYSVPEPSPSHTGGKSLVATGEKTRTTQEAYFCGAIPAGTSVRVLAYSNAGFNGITAYVEILEGIRTGNRATISAGLLEALR